MVKMENKDLEHEIKKAYSNSSLIAITAYLFYFAGKKIEDYF